MRKLPATAAADLLDIIMRRHEHRSTMITTNRPTEDWACFMGDVPAATAILDRFLEHCEILLMEGRSYRLGRRLVAHAAEHPGEDAAGAADLSENGTGSESEPRVRRRPRADDQRDQLAPPA